MGQLMGGVPILLALAACSIFCCRVSGNPGNEITLGREQVFVQIQYGSTFSLMMEPEDKMQDLFLDIASHEGIPIHVFQLLKDGTKLGYDGKLSDHNIQAGSTVTLVIPEDRVRYTSNFIVKTRDGKELQVLTKLGNSVASLKKNITQKTGIPQAEMRILLNAKELKDERRLADYCIFDGSTLTLGRPLKHYGQVVKIFVKALNGATLAIEVNLADTVDSLKEKIWEQAGVPAGAQRLFANKQLIVGEDRLCDVGLEDGSSVYMILYSSGIKDLQEVARLQPVAHSIEPEKGPIFREVDDAGEPGDSLLRPASLYRDARNWMIRDVRRPVWDDELFDPVAHLHVNSNDEEWIKSQTHEIERLSANSESELLDLSFKKLSVAVWPYRKAANLTSVNNPTQRPGITLGGGFTDASPNRPVLLGADINNYTPDNFTDSGLIRLFEVSGRVRELLARSESTGKGILSIAKQRRINHGILSAYMKALAAGSSPSIEFNHPEDNQEFEPVV